MSVSSRRSLGAGGAATSSRPRRPVRSRPHALGAHEVVDGRSGQFADELDAVDLIFDTVGGEFPVHAPALLAKGGRLVSVAAEPPRKGSYFVVEPNRAQLIELAKLVDSGQLRVAIDSTFTLAEAAAAFERSLASGKHGKVVIEVVDNKRSP